LLLFSTLAITATFSLLAAHSAYVIGLLGAIAFVLVPSLNALATSLVLGQAPPHLQGRATSAAIQISSLAAPIGPVVAGALLSAAGPARALVVYGTAYAALGILAAIAPSLSRHVTTPRSPEPALRR
jgi:MFS family permease